MFKIIETLKALMPRAEPLPQPDEAYLADAVDLYDLERRMREIDLRSRDRSPDLVFALGLR